MICLDVKNVIDVEGKEKVERESKAFLFTLEAEGRRDPSPAIRH